MSVKVKFKIGEKKGITANYTVNNDNPIRTVFKLNVPSVAFSKLIGSPYDNANLKDALDLKADKSELESDMAAVDEAISNVQTVIENNYNTLDNKIDNVNSELSGDISTLENTVNSNNTAVNSRIDATNQTVAELSTTVADNNTAINNRVDGIVETFDGDISALETAIQNEAATRANNDTLLQGNINTLRNDLTSEISNRTSADNTLQDNIDTLSSDLSDEVTARENADSIIGDSITALDNKFDSITGGLSDSITAIESTINNYGDIVSYNAAYFATANQGALADTALQPNDNISELVNDIGYITSASLPTINNATITIQKNGSSVGTFTLNQANNDTLNITVPTQASDIGAMPDTTTIEDLTTTAQLNALNSGATTAKIEQIATNTGNISSLSGTVTNNYNTLDGKITTLSGTVSSNYTTLDTKIDNAKSAIDNDISDLSDTVNQNYTDLNNAITTSASTINSRIDTEVNTLNTAITTENTQRQSADNNLQSQIDAITSASDVFDIVGTYAELEAYDISTVPTNDIIKVLVDSTHNNAATYYRCVENDGVKSWTYIGSEGAYYTKSEADNTFVTKTTTINNKPLSNNITLTANDVNALPADTVIGSGVITLQKNGVDIDSFNVNAMANKSINISVPTDTSDLTNNAGYITGINQADVLDALGFTPYNASNPDGFITSADLPTNYVTTDTVQDISGRKTFLGEKAIYFKQQATSNKLGFTLYNPSNTELAALEYRPNTIGSAPLLALNCPQTTGGYVGFRYWGNPAVNIVAPKVATAGNYFMATHITDGTNTVTANNQGTVNISTLLPDVSNYVTNTSLATTLADYVTNSALTTTLADYALSADIPTKTSDLTNDSNFATVSQIPTNNNQLTNGAGYITDSALTPYVLSSSLATVATSGSYNDLYDKPTIPAAQVQSDWNETNTSSKAYILNKPTIPAGVVVDQTYNGTSANAQSGVAIAGAGFLTGITSGMVTTALGYTPYNSSNPSGYQANVIETVKVNGTALTVTSKAVDVTVPTKVSDLTNDSGYTTNVGTVTKVNNTSPDSNGNVTISIPSAVTETTVSGWGFTKNTGTVTKVNNNSPDANGNVTLSIPAAQVQADWNVTNTSSVAYIKNKPTIPVVGNGTVTINQGGTQKGTFTLNQSGNTTINLDGLSYVAGTGIEIDTSSIPIISIDSMVVATKNELTDYVPLSALYNEILPNYARNDEIPTATSDLTNDSGYITNSALTGYATQTWVGQQGYLTNSALTDYITESTLFAALEHYQTVLISGENIKTINNTSLLSSGNIVVANTDLSNLSTTGQAVIDGKVSKSGDTMTGALTINVDTQNQLVLVNPSITKGTNPSKQKYYGIYFNDSQNLSADDWKDTRIGCIETRVNTNGTVTTSMQAIQNVADGTAKQSILALNITSAGEASCVFPDTECCDGQWVEKYLAVFSGVTAIGADDYSISSYLPNDGQAYEVLASMQMNDDGTTSGTDSAAAVGNVSKPIDNNCFRIMGNSDKGIWKPRFNGVLVFLGNQRKVYYQIKARALSQGLSLQFFGYRRIGTNS